MPTVSRRAPGRYTQAVVGGLLVAAAFATPVQAEAQVDTSCPAQAAVAAEAGWTALGSDDPVAARRHFEEALATCPAFGYAQTGLGYVELRAERDAEAQTLFQAAVAADPNAFDALTGLGLVAWRAGDLDAVRRWFLEVQRLVPDDPTALDYLARLPEGVGPPPERPVLVLPDTLEYPARAAGERFEIRTADGWTPFYVKGVNLGAALPGRFPSEFPDSSTYAAWIEGMAEMNANMVRVYTIHPPDFYEALWAWNQARPDRPLWLVHGVWTELPEDGDYLAPDFEGGFFEEMRNVVDLVHGRADIRPRAGQASGFYTRDLSPWTLAYIIGREWEPFSSMAFDSIHPGFRSWDGAYVALEDGNPMEAWLAKAVDYITRYETETYRAQRPVAYTNWPTLDPMTHVTESTREEEVAFREAGGEDVVFAPRDYDNDVMGLDATRMRARSGFPAGVFASFHAYPYYPDFMVLQASYAGARSSFGPSDYYGYLLDLKAHHPGMPVIVSEYGVPASHGPAHLQHQGRHHGGLPEAEMARVDRQLTLELAEAGMAGGALFAWIDEWFKRNWLVSQFELPRDRNRLWYNRLDAEQHYGVVALEARPPVEGSTLAARATSWSEIAPLYEGAGATVRAAADAAYLWLHIEVPHRGPGDRLMVGLDVIDKEAGDHRWPGAVGPVMPAGVEFVLIDSGDEVRVVADPPVNPFRLVEEGAETRLETAPEREVANAPAGFHRSRLGQRFNLPFISARNEDGRYDTLWVVPNRRRVGRDTLEYRAMVYDRGVLTPGAAPDGLWERDGGVLEVRIPWLLINVTDPSSRSVLASPGTQARGVGRTADGMVVLPNGDVVPPDTLIGDLGVTAVEDIGVMVALAGADGSFTNWPASGPEARFTWPTWEADEIEWRERRRPVFDAIRDTYRELDPYAGALPGAVADGERPDTARDPALEALSASAGPADESGESVGAARDRAAAAWQAGETDTARRLYQTVLAAQPDDDLALHRLALMQAWDGAYDESLALFERLLVVSPSNTEARIDRARVTAWAGRTDEAVALLDDVLADDASNPAALEARATFQAWAGRFDDALSSYDRLLAVAADPGAVVREQARVLGWASRYDRSRALYDSLLTVNPDDVEARLGLARVLTFSGDLEGAQQEYGLILDADPDNVTALQGLGRASSWNGDLIEGESWFRRAVEADPDDVTGLVGLAQNLRWQGRNAQALEHLRRARDLAPQDGDVREQLRWVDVALAPQLRSSAVVENDSDDNHMVSTTLRARWHPLPRLGVAAEVYRRDLSQHGLERVARGVTLSGGWTFEPGWRVTAGGGGSRNDGTGAGSLAAWLASVATPGRYPVSATLTVSSAALDATAALAERGVRVFGTDVSGRWSPTAAWRLNVAAGRAVFSGSEDNTRSSAAASLVRRVSPSWSVGIAGRVFGFEENLADGYFDPDFYGIGEATFAWRHAPGRWSASVEAAPGLQRVGSEGPATGSVRVSGRLAYSLAPGREISVSGGYSSTGLQSFSTGDSDYRYTAVIIGAAWVF